MNSPAVSIITVCYNAEDTVEKTIKSVLSQTYQNIEYVIVDGQSSDNTMAVIGRYKNHITKISSEKDCGVYDAMNKGIKFSSGDILYFLNADDYFYDESVVQDIVKQFASHPEAAVVYGKVSLYNLAPRAPLNYRLPFVSEIKNKKDFLVKSLCHQRVFARRWLFEKYGFFNTRYKISADFDWFLRLFNQAVNFRFIDRYIAHYNYQGLSKTQANPFITEKMKIIFFNFEFNDFLYYVSHATLKKIGRLP